MWGQVSITLANLIFVVYSTYVLWEGKRSVGACSLLDHNKRITGPDNSICVKSSLEPCSDRYRVTTYGISSINEWHASALHSNSQGGSDYQLVGVIVS